MKNNQLYLLYLLGLTLAACGKNDKPALEIQVPDHFRLADQSIEAHLEGDTIDIGYVQISLPDSGLTLDSYKFNTFTYTQQSFARLENVSFVGENFTLSYGRNNEIPHEIEQRKIWSEEKEVSIEYRLNLDGEAITLDDIALGNPEIYIDYMVHSSELIEMPGEESYLIRSLSLNHTDFRQLQGGLNARGYLTLQSQSLSSEELRSLALRFLKNHVHVHENEENLYLIDIHNQQLGDQVISVRKNFSITAIRRNGQSHKNEILEIGKNDSGLPNLVKDHVNLHLNPIEVACPETSNEFTACHKFSQDTELQSVDFWLHMEHRLQDQVIVSIHTYGEILDLASGNKFYTSSRQVFENNNTPDDEYVKGVQTFFVNLYQQLFEDISIQVHPGS